MLATFVHKYDETKYPIKIYSKFDWIKRRYTEQMFKIIDYYHNRDRVINNKNILSRIITNLSPNIYEDVSDYFIHIDKPSTYISKQYGLVSNINNGMVFNNVFYTGKSKEIINYVDISHNIFEFENKWEYYSPIRIVYTDETGYDFHLLDRSKEKKEESLTVYELDIKGMLLMYREWCKMRLVKGFSTNPNAFVAMYVIPNALQTMIDYITWNRFIEIYYTGSAPEFDNPHPFHVLDFSNGIDWILGKIIKDVDNTGVYINQLLKFIPTIVYKDMLQGLKLRRPYYNKQSEWAIWVARLRDMAFLIDILGTRGRQRNLQELKRFPVEIKMVEQGSTNLFDRLAMHPNLLEKTKGYIEEIKNVVGRR